MLALKNWSPDRTLAAIWNLQVDAQSAETLAVVSSASASFFLDESLFVGRVSFSIVFLHSLDGLVDRSGLLVEFATISFVLIWHRSPRFRVVWSVFLTGSRLPYPFSGDAMKMWFRTKPMIRAQRMVEEPCAGVGMVCSCRNRVLEPKQCDGDATKTGVELGSALCVQLSSVKMDRLSLWQCKR